MSRGHLAASIAAIALFFAAPSVASAQSFPLVGWWPLNEGSGQTVRDWSGKGNNGYLGSSPAADADDPSWIRGVFLGSALRFDGLDDLVTIPDAPALEPSRVTVSAWVRSSGSPGRLRYVMAKGANECNSSAYGLYTGDGGGIAFYVSSASAFHLSPEALPAKVWNGAWHNVAGTFDGSAVRLFVDGEEVGAGTPASVDISYEGTAGNGMIGSYPGGNVCFWNRLTLAGDVDGVQIWSTALPVDKIWSVLRPIINLAR